VNGVAQMPMHGVSFVSTFDDTNARSRHTQQYFAIWETEPCTGRLDRMLAAGSNPLED